MPLPSSFGGVEFFRLTRSGFLRLCLSLVSRLDQKSHPAKRWRNGASGTAGFELKADGLIAGSYFKYGNNSLNAAVPEQRNSSYIIISVDEITAPASRIRSNPTFQFHSAREPTASDATCTR